MTMMMVFTIENKNIMQQVIQIFLLTCTKYLNFLVYLHLR